MRHKIQRIRCTDGTGQEEYLYVHHKADPLAFAARQKFRFDLGAGFLAVINLAFLVISASDKLSWLVHIKARYMVFILVPAAILLVWFLGWLLDVFKFSNAYTAEQNKRNEMLRSVYDSTQIDGSP